MSTPSPAPFRLSSTLAGHESDVRSLTSSSKASSGTLCPTIYSSSRDGTARSWVRTIGIEGGEDWREEYVFGGEWHTGFVNAVQWIPGSNEEGSTGGSLITAGQDSLIHVWPLPSSSTTTPLLKPSNTLVGHTGNVCALGASKDGKRLVSGSWDKTGKVWNTSDFSLAYTLEGHEQAVWAVLALESDDELVLTGAADNLVKLWRKDKVINTFKGHTQAVRALAKLDSGVAGGDLFASAGNDGTIRLWSLSKGDAVHVLYGHDSFVYSLAAIPDSAGGGLVSGGEDRTMRVWRAADGECEQSITIPAVSVWTVACLSNGDIVAGSSDGLVRVFSRDESRVADLEALTAYDQQVSKTSVNSSQVGAINKNDLLGPEALDQPGKKEGQVLVIKNAAGGAEAYQWSRTTGWTSVGEVVDAVGSDRKQLYMGQEYDYVFDVDFKDGAQPLKLPYNASQNPYEAAQKFLLANELPLEYMDQVIDFIDKSTAGVTLGAASNEYVDPYTGASRYTGGGAGSTPAAPSGGFTGDPYTGGGRSVQAPVETKLLPHKTFLNFPQVNLPALRKKIGELNDTLAAGSASSAIALTPEELTALDKLLIAAGTSSVKAVGDSESAVAIKLLHWPSAQIFPPLDLIRVISRFAPLSESIPLLLQAIQNTAGPAKEQETNTMLAYRAFANTFGTKKGQELLVDEVDEIIETLSRRGFISVSKNGKVALATIVLNYSILAVQDKLESPSAAALFDFVGDLLRDSDGEVVYRSLVALGNLSLATKFSSSMPAAGLARYKTLAKDAVKRLPESRNKAIMVEIERGAR